MSKQIDSNRKKELIMEYKLMKPEMGIVLYACIPSGKNYIASSKNTKGTINSNTFQLKMNTHMNPNLQNEWKQYGESGFTISVAEVLEYDKDESKINYFKELKEFLEKWKAKLKNVEDLI